jgi:hypothetical protein
MLRSHSQHPWCIVGLRVLEDRSGECFVAADHLIHELKVAWSSESAYRSDALANRRRESGPNVHGRERAIRMAGTITAGGRGRPASSRISTRSAARVAICPLMSSAAIHSASDALNVSSREIEAEGSVDEDLEHAIEGEEPYRPLPGEVAQRPGVAAGNGRLQGLGRRFHFHGAGRRRGGQLGSIIRRRAATMAAWRTGFLGSLRSSIRRFRSRKASRFSTDSASAIITRWSTVEFPFGRQRQAIPPHRRPSPEPGGEAWGSRAHERREFFRDPADGVTIPT